MGIVDVCLIVGVVVVDVDNVDIVDVEGDNTVDDVDAVVSVVDEVEEYLVGAAAVVGSPSLPDLRIAPAAMADAASRKTGTAPMATSAGMCLPEGLSPEPSLLRLIVSCTSGVGCLSRPTPSLAPSPRLRLWG